MIFDSVNAALKKCLIVVFGFVALFAGGCVQSETPLLANAKPLMGANFEVHFYEDFVDGKASALHTASYRWTDKRYVLVSGNQRISNFVGVALDKENFLVEGVRQGNPGYSFWIAQKIVDGVYLIAAVDEEAADDATRTAACSGKKVEGACYVESEEQLMKLARATAAKALRDPTLGVLVLRREGV
ncbi:MAG: hypothetical protein ACKVP4_03370 [Hyphomicrobium sp.]